MYASYLLPRVLLSVGVPSTASVIARRGAAMAAVSIEIIPARPADSSLGWGRCGGLWARSPNARGDLSAKGEDVAPTVPGVGPPFLRADVGHWP